MKILVVGVFLDEDLILEFNKLSVEHAKISVAAVKYTKMILSGFIEYSRKDTEHIFLAPIGMFPQCKKLSWWHRNINGIRYIKFINIIFLKQLTITADLVINILKWNIKNKKDKRVIVFTSVYLPFLLSIIPFKLFTNIKFITFVPDIPEHSFSYSKNGGLLKKIFVSIYIYLANSLISLLDYFVFITKYMNDIYPDRPFTIIEGFADIKKTSDKTAEKSIPKAIMYSGALFEKFGIKNLMEAFIQIEGNYELWLFGKGDMIDQIKDFEKKDHRIKYFGEQPNSIILEEQKRATLLINPRFSHEEFTKFSFPSKLIEYLSSGTAVITTRLPGIPEEYYDKFYFIEDETIAGFRNKMEECLKRSEKELQLFGENGRNFVLLEKNYISQIKKLMVNLNNFFQKND